MSRKRGKPSKDALRRLVEEYDFLLTSSDALGISLGTESEILKDIMDQHPEYRRFKPGEEIRTKACALFSCFLDFVQLIRPSFIYYHL